MNERIMDPLCDASPVGVRKESQPRNEAGFLCGPPFAGASRRAWRSGHRAGIRGLFLQSRFRPLRPGVERCWSLDFHRHQYQRTDPFDIMRRFPGGGSQRKPTEVRGWLSLCAAIRTRFTACLAE